VIWSSLTLAGDFDLNALVTDEVSSNVKVLYKKIDAKLNEQYKILMRNPEFSYKNYSETESVPGLSTETFVVMGLVSLCLQVRWLNWRRKDA
jgi:uncharacterized protein YecT (DUF1311 family)